MIIVLYFEFFSLYLLINELNDIKDEILEKEFDFSKAIKNII